MKKENNSGSKEAVKDLQLVNVQVYTFGHFFNHRKYALEGAENNAER